MLGPTVSVIIPYFNSEKTLSRAIESVLNQRYPILEIILIDNNSIDDSRHIAYEYSKKYPDKFLLLSETIQNANAGGATHLVSGKDQEVAIQRLHIYRQVGHALRPVYQGQRPHAVRRIHQRSHRGEGAKHVGHGGKGKQARLFAEQRRQLGQVQRAVGQEWQVAQDRALLLGQHLPGDEVGVVLHLRQQDLIPGRDVGPAPTVGHQVDGFGSVAYVNHPGRVGGIDKAGNPPPGIFIGVGRVLAQTVNATMDIGMGLAVVGVHCLNDRQRLLRRGCTIQVYQWHTGMNLPLQNGEISANSVGV